MTTIFLLKILLKKSKSKMGKFPVYELVTVSLNLIFDISACNTAATSYMWLLKTIMFNETEKANLKLFKFN